jgi:peptidoglycan/LPS O-acetylase OafA/YrhL
MTMTKMNSASPSSAIIDEDETVREPFKSALLKQHMPGLDILRGVAILSVVFYHGLYLGPLVSPPIHTIWARLSSLFVFGWLGVFLFFVLSGFLIGAILLAKLLHKAGSAHSSCILRRDLSRQDV